MHNSRFAAVRHTAVSVMVWCTSGSDWRRALVLGAIVALVKLPFVFRTLGEDDQGRVIMNAIVYLEQGAKTQRPYGLYTSPLWVLTLAAVAARIGFSHLVFLTNLGGWFCGGAIVALTFVLLRKFGASRGWAVAGALAAALVPGAFYMSFYGFPSQYALPLMLLSMVAFATSVEDGRRPGSSVAWLLVCALAYVAMALTKIDFAILGTSLLATSLIMWKLQRCQTCATIFIGLLGVGAVFLVTSLALDGQGLVSFLTTVNKRHPFRDQQVMSKHALTTLYSCGFGTLFLLAAGFVGGVVRSGRRWLAVRALMGWALAALPIWIFWTARPPMSNRHAVPGAVITAVVAALLGYIAFRKLRYAPAVWLVALVVLNWPFGEPKKDLNYFPSGNLTGGLYANRKAYAVVDEFARMVAIDPAPYKVVVGPRRWDRFDRIDFVPPTEVKMAEQAISVRVVGLAAQGGWQHEYTWRDSTKTQLYAYLSPGQAASKLSTGMSLDQTQVAYYAPWGGNMTPFTRINASIVNYDTEARFQEIRPRWVYRIFE